MKEFTAEGAKIQTAAAWECATCERVDEYYSLYVGLDVHKNSIAIGVAWPGRGEAEYRGEIANKPRTVAKLVQRLSEECGGGVVLFCYEAGPCGYALYRQIVESGHDCEVVAPSLVARKPPGIGSKPTVEMR